MSYKIEYILKQETPMVHFQGDEVGACIRASEMKPKLDKFIIKYLGGKEKIEKDIKDKGTASEFFNMFVQNPNENKSKKYELGNEWKWALNYKLKIIHTGTVKKEESKNLGPYFAGVMKGGIKKSLFCNGDIILIFFCFQKKLQEIIGNKDFIQTFFLLNNFGTRQNRGLGCFSVKEYNAKKNDELLKKHFDKRKIYKIDYGTVPGVNYNLILHDGTLLYQFLKSGMNFGGTYIKSYLTQYCNKKGVVGEKAVLKANGISPAIYKTKNEKYKPKNPEKNKEGHYIRALLGMAGSIEYIDALEENEKGNEVPRKVNKDGKDKLSVVKDIISISNEEIERIPSPIRYSIHDNVMYIIAEDIESEIYGKAITFTVKTDDKSVFKPAVLSIDIPIPTKDQFNLQNNTAIIDDLLKEYVCYVNNDKEFKDKMKVRNDFLNKKGQKGEVFYLAKEKLIIVAL